MKIKYFINIAYCNTPNNENIIHVNYFKNDCLDGEYKWWYDNGQLEIQHCYKNNKLNGESKWYYDDGKLYIHCYFKQNTLDGEYIKYHEDGSIQEHLFYDNGKVVKKMKYENKI